MNGSANLSPLPAPKALENYFLEARSKLLDLAGILDRIGRGAEAAEPAADPRLAKVREALEILNDTSGGRAERIQQVFSLKYDADWERPQSDRHASANGSAISTKDSFANYLKEAVHRAISDEKTEADEGNLRWIIDLARTGVLKHWTELTPKRFLEQYLWCVGSIAKDYATHEKYFQAQVDLFRRCDAARIVAEVGAIKAEWDINKSYLNTKMVEAVIATARKVASNWEAFKAEYLVLPDDPEAQTLDEWWPSYSALDRLPMVGDAIAWYLIRNLYGAPFFKPDLHINAITGHFFGTGKLHELAQAVRQYWPEVCSDERLKPVHLGIVDYILWWYRQATGEPNVT
jgi:endonuclease III